MRLGSPTPAMRADHLLASARHFGVGVGLGLEPIPTKAP
jgi:hypothetical protein